MLRKTLLSILLGTAALALLAAGCGGQTSQPPAAAKTLKVGAETTFPPFEFQDEKTKDYTGFDIELMKAVGKQIGYEVQVASLGFDALIPALDSSQIDVIASAMTITEERAKKVAFSKPYYQSGLSIVVRADNTSIQGFKDLVGRRIAVQIGTTSAEEAKKLKDAKVREFNSASEAYMELKAGGVDAVVNDLPVNQYYLAQGGAKDAKLLSDILSSESYGIAVNKKNTDLLNKINQALDDLKANGEYAKLYEKWFGQKPW